MFSAYVSHRSTRTYIWIGNQFIRQNYCKSWSAAPLVSGLNFPKVQLLAKSESIQHHAWLTLPCLKTWPHVWLVCLPFLWQVVPSSAMQNERSLYLTGVAKADDPFHKLLPGICQLDLSVTCTCSASHLCNHKFRSSNETHTHTHIYTDVSAAHHTSVWSRELSFCLFVFLTVRIFLSFSINYTVLIISVKYICSRLWQTAMMPLCRRGLVTALCVSSRYVPSVMRMILMPLVTLLSRRTSRHSKKQLPWKQVTGKAGALPTRSLG